MVGIKNSIIGGASLVALAQGHGLNKREGTIITSCTAPGVVALTFDDGPYIYSQSIVDALTKSGHKATFFQNGNNYGDIYSYGPLLLSMLAGGHQIASHTFHHADLGLMKTAAEITEEMALLETAHLALIGKAPTYMRPPFLSTSDLAISTLESLGYKITMVDNDTQDWAEAPIGQIETSIEWYKGNLTEGYALSLNHDPEEHTADTFVPSIIKYLDSIGKKSVTVGECLGDAPENWYRGQGTVPTNTTLPAPSSYTNGTTTKPSGKPSGGDTEPGHGPNAGRGAIPRYKGTGDDNKSNETSSSSGSGAAASPSGAYTGPLSNGANTLTGSVLALCGAALIAFLL